MREMFKFKPKKTPQTETTAPYTNTSLSSLACAQTEETSIAPATLDASDIFDLASFDSDESSNPNDSSDSDEDIHIPVDKAEEAQSANLQTQTSRHIPAVDTCSTSSPGRFFEPAEAEVLLIDVGRGEEQRVTRPNVHLLPRVPPRKRRKLDTPYRVQRERNRLARKRGLEESWMAISKLLQSKKTIFESGQLGLQHRRANAIECLLRLVTKKGHTFTSASEVAAEAHQFSKKYGARQLRGWTRRWMKGRELPKSMRGRHAKVYTVMLEPAIALELRTYLRSEKWAMNPEKLVQFTQNKLIPSVADAYLRKIIKEEMPRGLQRYMEVELFPRIQLKARRGVSISTARRWMRREGFRYISYKKGLYFDGHDRPDVVDYRQNNFLPAMKEHADRLVQYLVGNVEEEATGQPKNYVERRLVLCAHDEMTAQANDANVKSWVLEDQHALRKKGVGRGIHQSDVICSTVGWLKDASQTLEYGKNYEGYWTGELFIKQVCITFLQQ